MERTYSSRRPVSRIIRHRQRYIDRQPEQYSSSSRDSYLQRDTYIRHMHERHSIHGDHHIEPDTITRSTEHKHLYNYTI